MPDILKLFAGYYFHHDNFNMHTGYGNHGHINFGKFTGYYHDCIYSKQVVVIIDGILGTGIGTGYLIPVSDTGIGIQVWVRLVGYPSLQGRRYRQGVRGLPPKGG